MRLESHELEDGKGPLKVGRFCQRICFDTIVDYKRLIFKITRGGLNLKELKKKNKQKQQRL